MEAKGCEKCEGGLIDPPPVERIPAPIYAARAAQLQLGLLHFCDCDAGRGYQSHLQKRLNAIHTRRDPWSEQAWAGILDAALLSVPSPDVRFVGEHAK